MLWRSDFQPQTITKWKRLGICDGFPRTDCSDVLPNGMVQVGTEHLSSHPFHLQIRVCNTSGRQTIVLRQHIMVLHKHYSMALVTWRKLQPPQMINGTAGRPIWWMALGDLIDVAGISWGLKSMFSLLCVAGKGQREHLSISDPETNNLRECVDFLWTLFVSTVWDIVLKF